MANWSSDTIKTLLVEIEAKKIVLPVIQRRLVWDEDKMALLFDTVMNGNSFGGIMAVLEEQGTVPLFATRDFTIDGTPLASTEEKKVDITRRFIIDGQQRLQSFYIGIKGCTPNKRYLYIDLVRKGGFCFAADDASLPAEADDEDVEGKKNPCCWLKVNRLYEMLNGIGDDAGRVMDVADSIMENRAEDLPRDLQKKVIKNTGIFYNQFFKYPVIGISCVTLPLEDREKSRRMVVELFRRLNDGGTRLSSYDLVAAVFKGFSWKMEGFLEGLCKDFEDIGLTQDNLIKLLFILRDMPTKDMSDVREEDAEFAMQNSGRIRNALVGVRDFLKKAHLEDYYKSNRASFVPLYFIAYHLFHSALADSQIPNYFTKADTTCTDFVLIRNWMLHSLLNDVFRSKGAGWIPYKTGVNKIHACICGHKGGAFPMDDIFAVYVNHPLSNFSTTYTGDRLDSLSRSFVFYLMYCDGGLSKRTNDIDHVMPKSILEEKGKSPQMINSIVNYQLLDFSTNRGKKNDTPLKDWIDTCVENKATYLKEHFIPTDEALWDEDNFEKFYEARANLLCERIKSFFA